MRTSEGQLRVARPIFDELRGPRVLIRPYRLSDAEERFVAVEESREHLRPWEPEQAEECRSVAESRDWIRSRPGLPGLRWSAPRMCLRLL